MGYFIQHTIPNTSENLYLCNGRSFGKDYIFGSSLSAIKMQKDEAGKLSIMMQNRGWQNVEIVPAF